MEDNTIITINDDPQNWSVVDIFTARFWRFLLVGSISVILMFLWVYYAGDSKQIQFETSVLPLEERQDMFFRTTGPRVVIFVMSNRIDDALCFSVGSAHLNGFPVVVAGYQMPYSDFVDKFTFVERAIENSELDPTDVVVALDSDTIFMGVDFNPFLDRFLAQSASTPEELDALAVRQGRAMAPVLISGEWGCWAGNLFADRSVCKSRYESFYELVRNYSSKHPEHGLTLPFDLSPQRNLNSGATVARVWAIKELLQKSRNLTQTQKPPFRSQFGWYCDQSIYAMLYLDQIKWEVEDDVFSMPLPERQAVRSPYGVRAGLVGLEYTNEFTVVGGMVQLFLFEMHDEHWAKYLAGDELEHPHSSYVTDKKEISQFVTDLYKRAYAAHGDGIYTRLAVPKWIGGRKTTRTDCITLTPPLFAIELRPIDTVGNTTRRTYPVIFHGAGQDPSYTKVEKIEYGLFSAQWFVPMVYDTKAKKQTMKYLESVPLFLSTNNSVIRDSYHAKCGFPFEGTVKKLQDL